jgi:hypothetical protein
MSSSIIRNGLGDVKNHTNPFSKKKSYPQKSSHNFPHSKRVKIFAQQLLMSKNYTLKNGYNIRSSFLKE